MNRFSYISVLLFSLSLIPGCTTHYSGIVEPTIFFLDQVDRDVVEKDERNEKIYVPKMKWIDDKTLNVTVTIMEVLFIPTDDNLSLDVQDDEIILKYNVELPYSNMKLPNSNETLDGEYGRISRIQFSLNINNIKKKNYSLKILGNKEINFEKIVNQRDGADRKN
ncbi:hypothetical protein D1AOALGA4SA_5232 [Olavius algarvensis Delta 1 endosymbiont]|nr:hypothetical protein D1AOALGA4SA_5232 [Olavius algarvensis Delta 1 endosymbiont]